MYVCMSYFEFFFKLQINMIVLSQPQPKISSYTPVHNVAKWALFLFGNIFAIDQSFRTFALFICLFILIIIPDFCYYRRDRDGDKSQTLLSCSSI